MTIEEELPQALRAQAATVQADPDAWEKFSSVPMGVAGHNRRWWLALPTLAAAAVIVLFVARTTPAHRASVQSTPGGTIAPSPTPSAAPGTGSVPPTTAAPKPVGPVGGPVPAGFQAKSVTFVSAKTGWVLGTAPCGQPPCTSIVRTTDGGLTWRGIPAPRANGITTLRFADLLDGWAFGSAGLWSTHDGGATWTSDNLAQIEDVEASAGHVWIAALEPPDVVIFGSDVHATQYVKELALSLGAGPVPTGQFALQGGNGWFLQVDRTVVSGALLHNGTWSAWKTPACGDAGGPGVIAAESSTALVAACDVGVWTGGNPHEMLQQFPDGVTPQPGPNLPGLGQVEGLAAAGDTVQIAGNGASDSAVIETAGGQVEFQSNGPAELSDFGFTTATQGVAVEQGGAGSDQLLMTHDGGKSWAPVAF